LRKGKAHITVVKFSWNST